MAQVKPTLTLDVNVGPSSLVGVGGSGTSTTLRAHQNAVNNKVQNQIHASTFGPQSDYSSAAYNTNDFDQQPDNGGFSSDEDGRDVYAAGASRLKAGSSSAGARPTPDHAHQAPARYQQHHHHHHQQQQQHPNRTSNGSEYDQSEDAYRHDVYAQNGESHHQMADGIHDEMIYEDEDDEGQDIEDDESDLSSSPSIPDENINFDLVYALHNFVATVEGQATVHKGNSLTLLDDSNSYWWLVRVLRTQEVGYIPAENIETPFERLARLNKHRNVDLTSATDDDHIQVPEKIFTSHLVKARNATGTAGVSLHSGKLSALSRRAQGAPAPLTKEQRRNKRGVAFGPPTYLEHSGDEYSDYDEDAEEHEIEYEEDADGIYADHEHDQEEDEHDEDEQNQNQGHAQRNKAVAFNKMEPDDGMEWDGQEAERIQQQHQDAMRAAASHDQQQQVMSNPYSQQYGNKAAAGPSQGYAGQGQRNNNEQDQYQQQQGPQDHRQQQQQQQQQQQSQQYQHQQYQHQQQREGPSNANGDEQMYANGRSSTSSQQLGVAGPSYGAQAPNRVPGEHMRTTSAERSISSINSGASGYDASVRPNSIVVSRNSTSSSNGFLPSHIQRERANSDASANSTVIAADSSSLFDKDKRKSNRSSKSNVTLEVQDEKAGKKRSGVFSLFSRKDKKDRKSGNFDDRDSMAGISSQDSFADHGRGRGSPAGSANTDNPVVQAANAGLQPGQSIGMGKAVQDRDRATQEAYQKQFLSPQNSSFDSSQLASPNMQDGQRRLQQRPGSLVGPSGSTPMLSVLRVFAGEGVDSDSTFKTVLLNDSTRSVDLQRQALQRFGVNLHDMDKYVLTIKRLEGDERPLDEEERPLRLFNTLTAILHQGQVTVPSVKRSSVGSISSISSNLSTHPAIARLGNDFSDDHAVKFYISRCDRLQGYVDLSGNHTADESGRSVANVSDLSVSQDNSNVTSLSLGGGEDAARSSHSSVLTGETSETVQSPTARFALRLVIHASDLPDGVVFDPQSNALIPAATLRESHGMAEGNMQHRFREKILTFPRNTTVAEVVEEGLDRFGIAEGVVEGGDDVEDRPSRRKSKLHVKYGLAVQAADGERALPPTSKVLDAYPVPPTFKVGIGNRRSVDGKRRSIDAAALLGASDDVGANDPVFVLRQTTHAHAGPKSRQPNGNVGVRAHSPTDNALAAVQEERESHPHQQATPATPSPRLGSARELDQTTPKQQNMTPQEIIAAQRAAAAERNAAVLGAQRNAQQGVDVMLSNQARIRSTKAAAGNKFRYSYVPADGQERDISSIIEDVMRDQTHSSADSHLSAMDATRPAFGTKKSMQSVSTTTDVEYASAHSSGAESPLSLKEVDFQVDSTAPLMFGGKKRISPTTETGAGVSEGRDLLDTLLRSGGGGGGAGVLQGEVDVEERINAVLDRVQSPPTPSTISNITNPTAAAMAAPGTRSVSAPQPATTHRKHPSLTSELSRDTSSPLTVGTSSNTTHATNTTGTMLTPLSTFVAPNTITTIPNAGSRGVGLRSASTGTPNSRSTTPSAYPSYAALSFGADDASLSHLYTIVEAAARRDPRKVKLMSHASMSSISSTTSPVLNSSALMSGSVGSGSRPGSKLSTRTTAVLLEDEKEALKPEVGGLFAPNMPFVEDKKLREAFGGISRELEGIEGNLDALLADVIRIF
ncbi:hypothetical protein NDA11_006294 [Ustilago hordei]|uniref:SH3 domain-containing protein n=1 Tax=Ustilago hordei TaxID=120017 RepID=I2G6G9_USTHO|nr:uncharacterized protein UHO2_02103 [Ustilago hordei]KAJ1038992.1 hypothetical protein NDA10_003219 [Ustilago hordei]KAJ1585706.1 hypothetical protein NDA12_000971 [Ustilago hordei]KAJ1589147.1 hypothetical protein NDA15_002777 [Ustilago hordei]KAJ1591116.1 hypothetical protein NDA11_006294 [Ustilago hordei]KAJ1600431.1 hypothetical protein NDA14_000217 [Ustilago hordei]